MEVVTTVTTPKKPPVNVKVVAGKAAHTAGRREYKPPPKTALLYEFVELQTMLLRPDADMMMLPDLECHFHPKPEAKKPSSSVATTWSIWFVVTKPWFWTSGLQSPNP